MMINDYLALIMAWLGVFFSFYEVELFYGDIDWVTGSGGLEKSGSDSQYQENGDNSALRTMTMLTSFVLAGLVINHYKILIHFLRAKLKIDYEDTLRSSGLHIPLIIETAYVLIHCPPGMNMVFTFEQHGGKIEYSINQLIAIIMLGRIYLVWRIFTMYSSWNQQKADEICQQCLTDGGVHFSLKAELKERPLTILISVILMSILLFGIALRTAERPFKGHSGQDWDYAWNGMWCIVITMTTVGFGDFYPSTHLGRMIGVMAALWGTFLVSLMVVALTNMAEFDKGQQYAYEAINRENLDFKRKEIAANAIKFSVKTWMFLKNNPHAVDSSKAAQLNKFKAAMLTYRDYKRKKALIEQDAPIEYTFGMLNDKVKYGLDIIKSDVKWYRKIIQRLDTAETNMTKQEETITQLNVISKDIYQKVGRMMQMNLGKRINPTNETKEASPGRKRQQNQKRKENHDKSPHRRK